MAQPSDAPSGTTPIAHVSFTQVVPPDRTSRTPSVGTIAIGAASALALAVILGLLLTPKMRTGPVAIASKAQPAVLTPAVQAERFTFARAREGYRPPDAEEVARAYAAVQGAVRAGGASELVRQAMGCLGSLQQAPAYRLMDYCLAFDLFAGAEHARLAVGESPSVSSWFGSAGARDLNVAQSIMAEQGDADARLLDLRRLATAVSRRHGGQGLDAAPSLAPPPVAAAVAAAAPADAAPADQGLAVQVVQPAAPAPRRGALLQPAPARASPVARPAPVELPPVADARTPEPEIARPAGRVTLPALPAAEAEVRTGAPADEAE